MNYFNMFEEPNTLTDFYTNITLYRKQKKVPARIPLYISDQYIPLDEDIKIAVDETIDEIENYLFTARSLWPENKK